MSGLRGHDYWYMKNTIIYFTGTGNSLAVARLLAIKLGQIDIFSVTEMLKRSDLRLDAETCGFVFPVYCQNAPEIVTRLVRRMQLPANVYIYAIATYNRDVGYSHFTLDRIFGKRGQRLQAGFAVLMPGNSITPSNLTNSENETQRRIKAASSHIAQISEDILKKASLPFEGSGSLRKHLKGFRNMFRHQVVFNVPKKFWITDACNRCGLCTRICPENNIRVDSDTLTWGKHCQMCLACIHWCSRHAIQNGKGTLNLKRYHHPDISIDDMFCRE
jgi:Pyruvate/2-oxoacid:ferredoxin oxidoreductase delta subunit